MTLSFFTPKKPVGTIFFGMILIASLVLNWILFSQKNIPLPVSTAPATIQPQQNTVYKAKYRGFDVLYFTNWQQAYAADLPEDSNLGRVRMKTTYSTGLKKEHSSFFDFQKLEQPDSIFSLREHNALIWDLNDFLVSIDQKIVYVLLTVGDSRSNEYRLLSIDTENHRTDQLWVTHVETKEKQSINSEKVTFGSINGNHLFFAVGETEYDCFPNNKFVINTTSKEIIQLGNATNIQINREDSTVSYQPMKKITEQCYIGGGYSQDQLQKIQSARQPTITVALP